jgi:hypothetical protein
MPDVNELEELGLNSLKEFWGLDNGFVETLSKQQVSILIKKASLGMQFYREINVGKRAVESNTLRVCTMLAGDKDELKRLLKASLPQYYISPKK